MAMEADPYFLPQIWQIMAIGSLYFLGFGEPKPPELFDLAMPPEAAIPPPPPEGEGELPRFLATNPPGPLQPF